MSNPLRPELYKRLCNNFSEVRIANEGEEMRCRIVTNPRTRRRECLVEHPGEFYKVSCCYCSDTRFRLWINHRFGRYDRAANTDFLFLAHCFNEECLREPGRARQLRDRLFNDFLNGRQPDPILPGIKPVKRLGEVKPAGSVYGLDMLQPDHHARTYLQSRGFDPDRLSREYGVGYCLEPAWEFPAMRGPIVAPVWFRGKLVGWQGRYVGNPVPDGTPKYFTMPGLHKNQILYNFDRARQCSFGVIVEGVTDVWSFGPEAVALFGNPSLASKWRSSSRKCVAWLLRASQRCRCGSAGRRWPSCWMQMRQMLQWRCTTPCTTSKTGA